VALLPFERPHPEAPRLRLGRNRRRRDPLPWGRTLVGAFVLGVGAVLAWALPVPRLPAPTGAWPVGSTSFVLELVDARGAPIGAGGATVVRLWYPVAAAEEVADRAAAPEADLGPAPWVENADRVLPAMAASGGLPSWAFGHLALVRTHARWHAPLAVPDGGARWPVVTFDHGLGGFRSQNTVLAEDLASHGTGVVAVEHPGGSLTTVLPDGSARPFEPLPRRDDPGYAAEVAGVGARWTAETLAALTALARSAPSGPLAPFAGALDLGRVVAIGHSTGGAVAVDVCHAWSGCTVAVALDGWWGPLDADRRARGSAKPLVSVASDPAVGYFGPENRTAFERFAGAGTAAVVDLVLVGAGHHDLNDSALLSPVADRFGHSTGPVRSAHAFAAVARVALAAVEATATLPAGPPRVERFAVRTDEAVSVQVAAHVLRAAAEHPVLVAGDAAFGDAALGGAPVGP
jgi:dienelactone hydrolase